MPVNQCSYVAGVGVFWIDGVCMLPMSCVLVDASVRRGCDSGNDDGIVYKCNAVIDDL
jgi:hypothetical protein